MTEQPKRSQLKAPRERGIPWRIIAAAVGALVVLGAVAVPLYATSDPTFYGRYQRYADRYKAWKTSSHKDVACMQCHVGSDNAVVRNAGLVGEYYRSKPNALRPAIATLPPASSAGCRKCHKNERAFNVKRLMQVPHPAHPDLAKETRDCISCHKWVAHSEKYQKRHTTMPFTGICISFGCHAGTKKKDECKLCHHTQSFKPADWRKQHPSVVDRRGENNCMDYCHKPAQCRTCHETGKNPFEEKGTAPKRLTGLIAKHSASNWDAVHGQEAQADEERCFYCHGSAEACKDCHSRRPAFHGPKSTWLGRHQKLGKGKKEARCLACHVKKDCNDCHRVFKEGR